MWVGLGLVKGPVGGVVINVSHCHVSNHGHSKIRMSLEAERDDGDEDEENRGE